MPPLLNRLISIAALLGATIVSGAVASEGEVQDGEAAQITFEHDVMAVLSKAGCNSGPCHGNQKGKGGFRLSLRGESPLMDFDAIVNSTSARRISLSSPEESLLLKKPTLQTGHEGKKRFEVDSPEYKILHAWLQQGAKLSHTDLPKLTKLAATPSSAIVQSPQSTVQLQVTAAFSNGTTRDVTRLAVYEPFSLNVKVTRDGLVQRNADGEATISVRYLHLQVPVRVAFIPARTDWRWNGTTAYNFVDEHVFAKLRILRMNPSGDCSDTEFARRAWLDVTGRLPSGEEARAFVHDEDPDKRPKLVRRLLQRPEFADFWALKWSDLLRIEEKVLDSTGVSAFHQWIRDSINSGMPIDVFARKILTATGSTYENPPANYYRSLRNPTIRAEAAAQVFLGTRMQCARCHNHPYEKWTQDQYYEFAAAFDGIRYEIVSNSRRDGFDKHQFRGEQLVMLTSLREQTHPQTKQYPNVGLLDSAPSLEPIVSPISTDRSPLSTFATNRAYFASLRTAAPERRQLQQMAEWMTSPSNELFARTQVNRVWFHLFGQGIIDPVDDLRATNPPVNPQLMEALVQHFISNGFGLRDLIYTITSSRTYGLSSRSNSSNALDRSNFSHAKVHRLGAEQLLDAIHQVTGVRVRLKDQPAGRRAVQIAGVPIAARQLEPGSCEQFLKTFGKPLRLLNSEMERTNETSLAQVLEMVSGATVHRVLSHEDNRIRDWTDQIAKGENPDNVIAQCFWEALSRPPTDVELQILGNHLSSSQDKRGALEDIVWSLLNSKEFLLRH